MRVEITTKKDNPILGRKEIEFTVKETKITPSRKELREKIVALTNSDKKNLVIGVLEGNYGTSELKGTARIYNNPEDLKKTELKHMVTRNFGEKKKAKGAEDKPAAAPEAPKSAEAQAKGAQQSAKGAPKAEAKVEEKKEVKAEAQAEGATKGAQQGTEAPKGETPKEEPKPEVPKGKKQDKKE